MFSFRDLPELHRHGAFQKEKLTPMRNGTTMEHWFLTYGDRFYFDGVFASLEGWDVVETNNDAPYFGLYANRTERVVLEYTEGDAYVIHCPDDLTFRLVLNRHLDFHGAPR